ncbi:MAG: HD domain-containing protein [Clostridium sp.]
MDMKNMYIIKEDIFNKYGSLVVAKGTRLILDNTTIDRLSRMGIDISRIAEGLGSNNIEAKEKNKMEEVGKKLFKESSIIERLQLRDKSFVESARVVEDVIRGSSIEIKTYLKNFYNALPWYYTHSVNVSIIAAFIARKLNYKEEIIKDIVIGALLHDIGMMGVSNDSSLGTGKSLEELQDRNLKKHCEIGYGIVINSKIPPISKRIILQHHELMDGSGYPNMLTERDIEATSKIVLVADIFDLETYFSKGQCANTIIRGMIEDNRRYPSSYVRYLLGVFK